MVLNAYTVSINILHTRRCDITYFWIPGFYRLLEGMSAEYYREKANASQVGVLEVLAV